MDKIDTKKKQVLKTYGEMRLSLELHELGWQVNKGYFDVGISFTITKYYCSICNKYSNQNIRSTIGNEEMVNCVTNLCEHCNETELKVVSRYLIVEIQEGIKTGKDNIRKFSFHPKIRYNMGEEVFYVWIAIFDDTAEKKCHFYILNTKDVVKFDNISLDTYQVTDNQKTELPIRSDGVVLKKGSTTTGYDYSVFNSRFYNDFNALEIELRP